MAENRGEGFPQILHNRARSAGDRLHSLLISLSTALVGVTFFALTAEVKPTLTTMQRYSLLVALLTLSVSVFAGVIGVRAEMLRYLFHARALQKDGKAAVDALYKLRDRWLRRERVASDLQEFSFLAGLAAVAVYGTLRLL